MNFSVVLIAKNEGKTLPKLMNSLEEFKIRGGEVILVDTGSTDDTVATAKLLGCKVFEEGTRFLKTINGETAKNIYEKFMVQGEAPPIVEGDKLFDYSEARNYAASLARNDMVAMPDCDEAYTKLDLDVINQLIGGGIGQFEYNFVFSHDEFGNEAIKFVHSKFYDRTKMNWEGIIHEILKGDVHRMFLGEDVIKLEHWQNVEQNRTHYLKGLALDCFNNPDNDRNSHYFGRELMYTGRYHSAIKEFERHLEISKWKPERSQSMVFMGECYEKLGNEKSAIDCYERAITEDPNRREPLIRLAEHYFRKDIPILTKVYAAAALDIPWTSFYANQASHYKQTPHELLYWAYWYLGDKEKSKDHFDKAFEFQPLNSKYLNDYRFYYNLPAVSFLLPTLGRPSGLDRCIHSISSLNYPQEKIDVVVLEGEGTVPEKVNDGFMKCKGEWIVYAANDTEFTPDSLMIALTQGQGKKLVAFHEGDILPDEGNINTHFMIHADLVVELDEIFDEEFHHVGVDNLLWHKAKKKGQAIHCTEAKIIHHHFSKGAEFDTIYEKGWSKVEQDRELLKKKLEKLYA